METIEERAKAILLEYKKQPTAIDLYSRDEVLKMLVKMATEQNKIDIEKACKWFGLRYADNITEYLRKAMEEEK